MYDDVMCYFLAGSTSVGGHLLRRVPGGHVCSSGGVERSPCGRIQHGRHTRYHALQVCLGTITHTHTLVGTRWHLRFLCFRFHFQGPCGTTLPLALARHETETDIDWQQDTVRQSDTPVRWKQEICKNLHVLADLQQKFGENKVLFSVASSFIFAFITAVFIVELPFL